MNSVAGEPLERNSGDGGPIQMPGAILPHGAMLVIDADTFEILQAGGDTAALLGASANELLCTNLALLFRPRPLARLRAICNLNPLVKPRHLFNLTSRAKKSALLDVSVHRSDGLLVLEFEAAPVADRRSVDALRCVQGMIEGLETRGSLQMFCQLAAECVRSVSGFDRVMIYRFLDDDSGWVFAESREERLDPFLDLHFPAAAIPQQRRALYLQSNVRLVRHVGDEPSSLIPPLNPRTHQPLDMSQSILRDVLLLDREYLRNMGVEAAMSMSITSEGKLWGLITCHHYSARQFPRYLRSICEVFSSMFSLRLEAHQRAEMLEARLVKRQMLERLMRNLAAEGDYAQGVVRQLPALLDYMTLNHPPGGGASADERQCGIAVRLNHHISVYGNTPREGDIEALIQWLAVQASDHDRVFMTDRLGELWEPAKEFAAVGAGLLVLTVSRESRDFVLWFRPECIETLHRCAFPPEVIESQPPEDRLKTRKRFEDARATVRGRSRPWRASDWEAGLDLHAALLGFVLRCIEDAARERAQARAQELLLLTELDHRVKDTVANSRALVLQSSRSGRLLRGLTQSLDHRIYAMDKAHRLLTERRWEGVSIGDLLHEELDAHRRDLGRVALSGPDVVLTPQAALAMSLAFHELCMNAAKYGSLSLPGGRVSIRWHMTKAGGVELSWQEADGPLVRPPQQRGFGSNLIEHALAMETGGHSTLEFERGGVTCTVVLPMSSIVKLKSIPVDACCPGTNADGRP